MEEQVDFLHQEQRLFGMLHQPADPPKGGVVFLHGFGGHRSEVGRLFVRTARRLAEQGIACLRFDFIGSGDSEGEDFDSSILTQLEDAIVAYRFFRDRMQLEAEQIGVLGYSLGGAVALLLSDRVPFHSMVLWAPVTDPLKTTAERLEIEPEQVLQMPAYDVGTRRVGRQFVLELGELNPLNAVSGFKGELLTIHGTKDDVVYPYHSDGLTGADLKWAKKAERILIEGADHAFGSKEWSRQLIDQTASWFDRSLDSTA